MADLAQLEDVKTWLNLKASDTGPDAVLNRLITAVSRDFLSAIDRHDLVPSASYIDIIDHKWDSPAREWRWTNAIRRDILSLRHWPIQSVEEVTIDGGTPLADSDGLTDGWYFDAAEEPEARNSLFIVGHENNTRRLNSSTIKVTYHAGYAETLIMGEAWNIPATPFKVTVAGSKKFVSEAGVKFQSNNAPLLKVGAAPVTGQYSVDAAGVYTFAAADVGLTVLISYNESGVPVDIEQAVIDWVAYRYTLKQSIGQTAKHFQQGESVQFQTADMPETTRAVVERYTRSSSLL